ADAPVLPASWPAHLWRLRPPVAWRGVPWPPAVSLRQPKPRLLCRLLRNPELDGQSPRGDHLGNGHGHPAGSGPAGVEDRDLPDDRWRTGYRDPVSRDPRCPPDRRLGPAGSEAPRSVPWGKARGLVACARQAGRDRLAPP